MSGTTSQITFQTIPSNLRVHGVFEEVVPAANNSQQNFRALIIGQVMTGVPGTAPVGVPLISSGVQDAITQGGQGSMLHLQTAYYKAVDPFGEVWYLPLADDAASTAATLTIGITGTATAAGTLPLYVTGVAVPVAVTSAMTAAQLATAVVAAIAANPNLPLTASVSGTTGVLLTAKNKGLNGNDLDVRLNYYGAPNGEVTPPGFTFTNLLSGTGTQLAGGATNPTTLSAALANLPPDVRFDYVHFPYTDATSLGVWKNFENNTAGRWSWTQMTYGGAFAAFRGTFANSYTFTSGLNDPAISITPVYDAPEPAWLWGATLCAASAVSLRVNPAIPLQELVLPLLPPPPQNVFNESERNSLLFAGGSTFTVNHAGQVITDRLITTYQTNAAGAPDSSYLDVETRYTLAYVAVDLRTYLASKYSRKIFVDDTTTVNPAINNVVATPKMIKASVINRYRYLEAQGLVQNSAAFAAAVQVQKVGSMCRILWPGNIANQLRQIGIQLAFTKT